MRRSREWTGPERFTPLHAALPVCCLDGLGRSSLRAPGPKAPGLVPLGMVVFLLGSWYGVLLLGWQKESPYLLLSGVLLTAVNGLWGACRRGGERIWIGRRGTMPFSAGAWPWLLLESGCCVGDGSETADLRGRGTGLGIGREEGLLLVLLGDLKAVLGAVQRSFRPFLVDVLRRCRQPVLGALL